MVLELMPDVAHSHPETDNELVERARKGDQDAFSELVRRHRAQAFGWANSIARDAYLAEDIVQEALIRAFLHLGNLIDTGRFLPWLNRIIRNQAYMKLRRGGPYGKERPFTALGIASGGTENESGRTADAGADDWSNVDRILFRLSRSAAEEAKQSADPVKGLLRYELLENLRELLQCLSKRERAIFEAHFFGELSPAEIAEMFGTSTANVYNLLSRSRGKVQKERIRVSISVYVKRRAELGHKRVHILPPPQL
ncbi:RNA polymerase sigma factor [Paenibacillus thermotolerans]|uniref:RNA polymerase sigma factor n=1 Tax=Paenibacillus thermotolerans TaxID=3027807 RepID=UPI0023686287|nr:MULTISPECIES: RNA polymerase sigma factor [unclassified Paenibacillus]